MKLFTARGPGREMTRKTENGHVTETPHYIPSHFTEPTHHTKLKNKQTMIVAKEAVFTQTLALLPPHPLLIFGRIPKCFDTAVCTFY